MAGIGFRLQKLISGESYTDLIKAYALSALIATGPMLIVILSLLLVQRMGKAWMGPEQGALFIGIVVYSFAGAMIGIGGILNIVTRYIADQYYRHNFDDFAPTFFTALELIFLLQSIPVLLFLHNFELLFHEKWIIYILYLLINGIWLAMVFLSAAKSYLWIVNAYLIGGIVTISAGWLFGAKIGFTGMIGSFTVGQAVTFFILVYRILREFGYKTNASYGFLTYFKKHFYLFLVGTCLNLGIWIDKFIMWRSPIREKIGPSLFMAPDYDTPLFLAFVVIIPSMAFFLIQMETTFAQSYADYFRLIANRESGSVILRAKENLLEIITKNFQKFVLLQGVISGLVILLVFDIAQIFNLNTAQLGILRISLLATFLQIGFIMFINLYYYFDFQKEAFWLSFLFFASNTLFTFVTLWIGRAAYGFGFAAACFVSFLASFLVLDYKLKRLDYFTFMKQPILLPKFDLEKE